MTSSPSSNFIFILRPSPDFLSESESFEKLITLVNRELSYSIPVHWNLPGELFRKDLSGYLSDEMNLLKERIKSGRDLLLSAGYTGKPHVLMNKKEIGSELEKGRRLIAQYMKGLRKKTFALPLFPDFTRTENLPVYGREGHFLSLKKKHNTVNEFKMIFPDGKEMNVAFLHPEVSSEFPINTGRRNPIEQVLILELSGSEEMNETENLLKNMKSCCKKECFLSLQEFTAEMPRTALPTASPTGIEGASFWNPKWREKLLLDDNNPPLLEPPDQNLIADMLGSITMEDDNFTVHFKKGRWAGISSRGLSIITRTRARCFLNFNGKSASFLPPAAYSFDSCHSRGLREIQKFSINKKKKGRIITDYYFTDDCPSLIISSTVEFPSFEKTDVINSFGLLEINLFEAEKKDFPIIIESNGNSLPSKIRELTPDPGDFYITGQSFRFKFGEKIFSLAIPESKLKHCSIPVRIRKKGKRFQILINPWGSYLPMAGTQLSTLIEHFTLLIEAGMEDEISEKEPPEDRFPDNRPFWINRREFLR